MFTALNGPGRTYPLPPAGSDVAITEANKSCTIKLTGRAWCTASNDVWGPLALSYPRYNRSGFVNLLNWTDVVSFEAVALPATLSTTAGSCDNYVVVMVDGVLQEVVTVPIGFMPWRFNVTLPAGSHTVQLWDGWQARQNNYNQAIDGVISACYVTSVRVPVGKSNPVPLTATRGVVTFGDSTNDGISDEPFSYYGWCGQVRRRLHTAGGLLGYIGWGGGTLTGDGFTASQFKDMIHDLWANMGCTTKQFMMAARPNDMAYYGLGGRNHPTISEFTQFVTDTLDALAISDPGFTALIAAPSFALGSSEQAGGGGTRTQYYNALSAAMVAYPNVTVIDLSATISAATDLAEGPTVGVHPNQAGQNKIANAMATGLGGI